MKDMGKKKKNKPQKGSKKRIKKEENLEDEHNDEEEGMDTYKEGNMREDGPSKA